MNKMKTLTLQGIPFEVVDGQARNDVEVLKESGWNELKDKPFGEDKAFEPISFVLDGNYDDVETFTMPNGQVLVKLYDKYVRKEAIESLSLTYNGETETITSDSIAEYGYGWTASIFASADGSEAGELPEGIWAMDAFKIVQTSVTANINPKVTLTKLDPKYLPDGIGGGGGVEILEATISEKNKKCLILPIATTEIAQQIASGKEVAIKAVITNKDGQIPETVLFRFASMNEANSIIFFVAFKPYFTMSAGQMLGACVLEMGYGDSQTEAWLSYIEG